MFGLRPQMTILTLSVALMAVPAFAKTVRNEPNWEAQPLYTTLDLAPDFNNDPRKVEIEAGGDQSMEGMGEDCAGFINWDKPDVDVNYANDKDAGSPAGTEQLSFYVKASKDTTMLVYTPDQKWVCVDDTSDSNENPSLTFKRPLAGNYNIWIGTYDSGSTQKATLYVTEGNPPR